MSSSPVKKYTALSFYSVIALICLYLTGCDTCSKSISYGEIGIKINPMACISKSKPTEQKKDSTQSAINTEN